MFTSVLKAIESKPKKEIQKDLTQLLIKAEFELNEEDKV